MNRLEVDWKFGIVSKPPLVGKSKVPPVVINRARTRNVGMWDAPELDDENNASSFRPHVSLNILWSQCDTFFLFLDTSIRETGFFIHFVFMMTTNLCKSSALIILLSIYYCILSTVKRNSQYVNTFWHANKLVLFIGTTIYIIPVKTSL